MTMPNVIRPALMALAALASATVATTLSGGEQVSASDQQPKIVVGEVVPQAMVEPIDRPGLYGVGDPSGNWVYAVVGSQLVRIDPETNVVLGVIRPVMLAN